MEILFATNVEKNLYEFYRILTNIFWTVEKCLGTKLAYMDAGKKSISIFIVYLEHILNGKKCFRY